MNIKPSGELRLSTVWVPAFALMCITAAAIAADSGVTLEIKLGTTIVRSWDDVKKAEYAYAPKQEYDAASDETHIYLPYGKDPKWYYEVRGTLYDPAPGALAKFHSPSGNDNGALTFKLHFDRPIGAFRYWAGWTELGLAQNTVAGVEYSVDGEAWKSICEVKGSEKGQAIIEPFVRDFKATGLNTDTLYIRHYTRDPKDPQGAGPGRWLQMRMSGSQDWGDAATTFFSNQLQLWVTPAKGGAAASVKPAVASGNAQEIEAAIKEARAAAQEARAAAQDARNAAQEARSAASAKPAEQPPIPASPVTVLPLPAGANRIQGGSFGIASGGESFGDHPRLFPMLHEAGATMIRSFPEWSSFQPERGKWDFSAGDGLVQSARKNQIEIVGLFCYLAPWASSAGPGADHGARTRTFPIKDGQYWRNYVAGVVTRYRNDIRYWEVYNEFNSPAFARSATVKDYVNMVCDAYDVAKKADPQCQIGIGCADVDISFLEQVIAQGAAGHFDFVNVHPYSLMGAAMSGREPVFLQMASNLRKMLAKTRQRPDIALWVSEIGVASTDKRENEDKQAEAIVKACVPCFAQGIDRVFWFEGRGPAYGTGGDFGIIRRDWSRRPSFAALRQMTMLLGPRPQFLGWLNPTGRSYGFVFNGSAGPVLISWASGDKGDTLKFPAAVTMTDLAGKATAISAGEDLVLSRVPVFITQLPQQLLADARSNHDRPLPWLRDFSGAESVSCLMGAANVENGLIETEGGDGKTVLGLVDGSYVRRTDRANRSLYMYFDVDDSYASVGDSQIDITFVARRVDAAKGGGFKLTYEAQKGYRATDEWWTIPAEAGWHEHTFHLKDANFANNWGWNFRIDAVSSATDIWVKEVTVKRIGAKK